MEDLSGSKEPFKRTVYFISGLHDFGFRYFWPFLKRGARDHSKIYGRKVHVEKTGEYDGSPEVTFKAHELEGPDVETTYRYMKWNDIVEDRMKIWFPFAFFHVLYLFLRIILSGDLYKIYRHYWGFGNGIIFMSLATLFFFGLGAGIAWFAAGLLGAMGWSLYAVMLIAGLTSVTIASRFENSLHIQLSYHLIRMRTDWPNGRAKDLEGRIDVFADTIAEALLNDDSDEILIVGHSYGTLVAVDVLAKALERVKGRALAPKNIGLITLGAIHHYIAVQKSAEFYRKSLAIVGGDERVNWFEPFCPQDGMNFPRCNPTVDFTNADPVYGPVQKSLKVKELLSPAHYKKFKRNFWHMHFQYLREGDIPGDYSYFRMICSNQYLQNNYGLREHVDLKG